MSMTIELETYDDEDNEVVVELPAKYGVCSTCEGHGTVLNPSIAEHAYSMEEFMETFDEEEREHYFNRGGMYDVPCTECKGARVVQVVDEDALNEKTKPIFERWQKRQIERERFDRAWSAERNAERAMGC